MVDRRGGAALACTLMMIDALTDEIEEIPGTLEATYGTASRR